MRILKSPGILNVLALYCLHCGSPELSIAKRTLLVWVPLRLRQVPLTKEVAWDLLENFRCGGLVHYLYTVVTKVRDVGAQVKYRNVLQHGCSQLTLACGSFRHLLQSEFSGASSPGQGYMI